MLIDLLSGWIPAFAGMIGSQLTYLCLFTRVSPPLTPQTASI
jgi:hypothetical protein